MQHVLAFIGMCTVLYFFVRLMLRVVRTYMYARMQTRARREEYARLGMSVVNRLVYDHSEYWH